MSQPPAQRLQITILGLSITSSWGNGHATTFRGLCRALAERGHKVRFLERDVPWYANARDMPEPPFCTTALYRDLEQLEAEHSGLVAESDLVIVGSYVPEGVAVGEWVQAIARGTTAFYDIDTPVTLTKLEQGNCEYLSPALVAGFDIYLSFTGGPTLEFLEKHYASPMARPLYCSFDADLYAPMDLEPVYDLGYMGTYSDDRQPTLERTLLEPAWRLSTGRFVVAGPQYPQSITWPPNVHRIEHLPPSEHRRFYNMQRFTLNVTRADMIRLGYSPSVRLFEAAACATPIISDPWQGLNQLFRPDEEILIARTPDHVLALLREMPESQRQQIGKRARRRVLTQHTASHRAFELERYVQESRERRAAHRQAATRQPMRIA